MPQTSPMNWSILSLTMILSILYSFSYNNEMMNYKTNKKTNFNLIIRSWNW